MHRYGKAIRLIAMILVIVTLAVSMPALAYNDNVSFSDVPSGEWYAGYVQKCAWLEIINGFGDGTFRPNDNVKRGEFIKMLAIAAELYTTKTSTAVHWAAPYWYMLSESGVLEDVSIPCTYASLEQTITRYEMAALLRNTLYNVYGENT
ncbi:MAG: S-layer homology domain-containing protein, partial [Clostridia bacterium]|nr:S-layer homology domain-containing protein [Clostridia bacterium]